MDPFEQLLLSFNREISRWELVGLSIGKNLFFYLAVIQLAWSAIIWMLERDNPASLLTEFAKRMMVVAFFFMLINNYHNWVPKIFESFRKTGEHMTGLSSGLSPWDVAREGIHLSSLILTTSNRFGILPDVAGAIVSAFSALIVLVVFVLIGIQMGLTLIGGKIILAGGVIMLGFAGSKWSMQFAERYITTAIHLGVKILFILLLVGIGQNVTPSWAKVIENAGGLFSPFGELLKAYFGVIAGTLLYGIMVVAIPSQAANLLTGVVGVSYGLPASTVALASYQGVRSTVTVTKSGVSNVMGRSSQSNTQISGQSVGRYFSSPGSQQLKSAPSSELKTGLSTEQISSRVEPQKTKTQATPKTGEKPSLPPQPQTVPPPKKL